MKRIREAGEEGQRRMKKLLTNNLGLKLLSLVIAFAIWLVVVNIDDPVITTSFSGVVVDVINGDSLTGKGKIYEISEGSDVINVTITGKRSVVETIGKENIRAVADINDLSLMDTVEIQLSTNKNNDQIDSIKSSTPSLALKIENLKEVHLSINLLVNGEPQEGYVVGDINANQNTVRVSGPESIINTIEYAEAAINISGRTSDISTSSDIKLYDKNKNLVESPYLSTNIRNINFSASILPVRAIDIEYGYIGEPEEGYMVSGDISAERSAIYVAGKSDIVDSITSIRIPSDVVDITGATKDFEKTINIKNYLPDGVRFADTSFTGKVTVKVPIAHVVDRAFDVKMSNIILINVPREYDAEVLLNSNAVSQNPEDTQETGVNLKVSTQGILEEYESLSEESVKGYVDVESYMKETGLQKLDDGMVYKIPITFNLPDRIVVDGTYYADVKIKAAQ